MTLPRAVASPLGIEEDLHRNRPAVKVGGAIAPAERYRRHKAMWLQTPVTLVPTSPRGLAERQVPPTTPAAEVSAVVTPAMAAPMVLVPAVFGPCR